MFVSFSFRKEPETYALAARITWPQQKQKWARKGDWKIIDLNSRKKEPDHNDDRRPSASSSSRSHPPCTVSISLFLRDRGLCVCISAHFVFRAANACGSDNNRTEKEQLCLQHLDARLYGPRSFLSSQIQRTQRTLGAGTQRRETDMNELHSAQWEYNTKIRRVNIVCNESSRPHHRWKECHLYSFLFSLYFYSILCYRRPPLLLLLHHHHHRRHRTLQFVLCVSRELTQGVSWLLANEDFLASTPCNTKKHFTRKRTTVQSTVAAKSKDLHFPRQQTLTKNPEPKYWFS